jgi:peroxiredoxin
VKIAILLFSLVSAAAAASTKSAALQSALQDKPAPAFSLPTVSGPPVRLSQLAGHVVVIEFWATWCGPCEMSTEHLDELHRKHAGVCVLGISQESAADVRQYVAEHKTAYKLAVDPDGSVTHAYQVPALPTVVIIDKAGIVRYASVGLPDFAALEAAVTKLDAK